ncbi:hypothetical protein ACLOJK_007479 [Asimina triloba]
MTAKPLGVGELAEVYSKTEEVIEEHVRVRGRYGITYKRPLEGLEDEEGPILKKGRRLIKASEKKSGTLARAIEVEAKEDKILEVEDALPLQSVLLNATGLLKPQVASKAMGPRFKGTKASELEMRDEPTTKATVV